MKFVFLVLHYKNEDVTAECINSIFETNQGEFDIVVVDNASGNGSVEKLQEQFGDRKNIHFLLNTENGGYARGNNVGFRYAKNTLHADFICLANNDLVFKQENWMEKVVQEYQQHAYYVCGPDIVTPGGEHQNPFKQHCVNKKIVLKKLFHDIVVYWLLCIGLQRKLRDKMKKGDGSVQSQAPYKETVRDFQGILHGSCLVFSPDYIKEYDGLYDGTFLYAEEEILCYVLHKEGQTYTYLSDLQVVHCHATSFKRSIDDEDKRKMQIVKHRIASYMKFVKIVFCKKDLGKFLRA